MMLITTMDLIHNNVKNNNGGYSWGTFVQKIVKTEVIFLACLYNNCPRPLRYIQLGGSAELCSSFNK